jgi:hypothetical protein
MKMNPHRTEWHVQNFEQYILDWRNQANVLTENDVDISSKNAILAA